MKKLTAKLEELFGIDIRALALMRISFSLIVLFDLLNQSRYIKAFYTDQGVMPRVFAIRELNENAFSLHLMGGTWGFEVFLFILAGIFAIGLLVGYRTRLCTFMTWFFLFSLHNRNLFLLNAGDRFLHICLFWCLFLPLGACYSIDSLRKPQHLPHPQVSSMGSFGYLMQVAFFYSFAGFLKTGHEWTTDGTAMYYVLSVEAFRGPLAHMLFQFPLLSKYLSLSVLWIERFGPLLFFCPWWTTYARLIGLGSFVAFQAGLLLIMYLQFFQWICLAALIGLFPPCLLDKIFGPFPPERFKQKKERMPVLLSLAAGFFIIYIFFWNMGGLQHSKYRVPHQMQWIGYLFNIDQHWGMFAPRPMTDDGWYIFPGKLRDGSVVDASSGMPVQWKKPSSIVEYNRDHRWALLHLYLSSNNNALYRVPYAKYLCTEWNSAHAMGQQLLTLDMIIMEKDTMPNYQKPFIHPVVILSYDCVRQAKISLPVFNKK